MPVSNKHIGVIRMSVAFLWHTAVSQHNISRFTRLVMFVKRIKPELSLSRCPAYVRECYSHVAYPQYLSIFFPKSVTAFSSLLSGFSSFFPPGGGPNCLRCSSYFLRTSSGET